MAFVHFLERPSMTIYSETSPIDATHRYEPYNGHVVWLKLVEWDQYNGVCEELQKRSRMEHWDNNKWVPCGMDFRPTSTLTKIT